MPTPPPYSLVATDLDGTLLRPDDTVSARSRAALALAASAGARHLIVTGRPVPGIRALLADLAYTGLVVCGQGTQLYEAGNGRLLRSVTLDREAADTAL
ncbi:HAD hydrolase family protein, partial [Streptomyces sp. ADI98-10]|uniref:HAD family hydrolase n=1 Tax=Streptomyces sp. ADI98-10 TaxID=1522763 RepID=UPI0013DDC3BB